MSNFWRIALLIGFCSPVNGAELTKLDMPPEAQSWQSLNRGLTGMIVTKDRIVSFAKDKPFVFDTKIKSLSGKKREENFGGLIESMRIEPYRKDMSNPRPVGGFLSNNKFVLINGDDWSVLELDRKTLAEIWRRSIVVDLLKPAADRGGEAPSFEIAQLRKDFAEAVRKTSRGVLAGVTEIPAESKNRRGFALFTKLKDFPLLFLECDKSAVSQCLVTRRCNLKLKKMIPAEHRSGIGFDPTRREFLLGDSENHRLVRAKFHSCGNVSESGAILLPGKMKPLSNIWVDTGRRLWLSSFLQDDYLNASLYFWDTW